MKRLTTHVLDTAKGIPAHGVKIELFSLAQEQAQLIKTVYTNSDGRTDEALLSGDSFQQGKWELVFHVGAYFADDASVAGQKPPFLDEVPIRFGLNSDVHYHVPLLVSPWSYSTYRGS